MSNVELLPLPEAVANWLGHMKVASGNDGSMETFLRWFEDYARANVEASTKYYRDMLRQGQDDVMKLSAETEALRAEVDALRSRLEDAIRDGLNEQVRAERLAEALRGALEIFEWNAIGGEVRKHIEAVLTLHPTAAQENDHA